MRMSGLCFSCAVALAAVFAEGSWAASSNNHNAANIKRSRNQISDPNRRGNAVKGGQKKVVEVVGVVEVATTSTTIISSPRITQAPGLSLVKRKLGGAHWDEIHEQLRGRKRDATICPADYNLCPASLNGGCCPSDRVCGMSSCLPTSSAASACGLAGYVACGVEDGGGCCPSSYVCGTAGCTPSAGVTNTQTCGYNSYLCPASLNYGCCQSGMACALNDCYSTSIVSFTLTETITTTSLSNILTYTTTITSSTVPNAPTATTTINAGIVAKVTESATPISKTAASGTPSSGLTTPQIGGIIGGAVGMLAIILIAAYLIMRRLNQTIKITRATQSKASSSAFPPRGDRPSVDVDAMSVDPLMMIPTEASSSIRYSNSTSTSRHLSSDSTTSASALIEDPQKYIYSGTAYEVEAPVPRPVFTSPFSPGTPPIAATMYKYPGGYTPLATNSDSTSGGGRTGSVEITPQGQYGQGGYFDLPLTSERPSVDSRYELGRGDRVARWGSGRHGRNWSDASDVSERSAGTGVSGLTSVDGKGSVGAVRNGEGVVELDAGSDGDRRFSLQRALQGLGIKRIVSRRRTHSDGAISARRGSNPQVGGTAMKEVKLTGGPIREGRRVGVGMGLGLGLGGIPEAGESRFEIDRGVSPLPEGLTSSPRASRGAGGIAEMDLGVGLTKAERERERERAGLAQGEGKETVRERSGERGDITIVRESVGGTKSQMEQISGRNLLEFEFEMRRSGGMG